MLGQVYYKEDKGKRLQAGFGGLNHTPACRDGELFDSGNLTADFFPVMASRQPRRLYQALGKANGLGGHDALMWVDGTAFFYNGVQKGTVTDSRKAFYFIGALVLIWPDKAYYNTLTDVYGRLEETYLSGAGEISIQDGTYAGVPAKKNSIVTTGAAFAFEAGEAVTISGCAVEKNNTVAIIREISEDKKTLRFYENAFTISSGTAYTEAGAVTIARSIPEMDFLCQHENRMWGCHGDEIFCSNLGNPKVWMDYDGLATGSWAVAVGSAGDFTGCASFMGYAMFFKEDRIYKVYGTKPSDFKALDGARRGLLRGCERSFAEAGETLLYHSPAGVVRYSGGYPYGIDLPLGELSPEAASAGSDGEKYYTSGVDKAGQAVFLCYDTRHKTWLREDGTLATDFVFVDGKLYFLAGNEIWCMSGTEEGAPEAEVLSFAEFGDFYENSPNKKGMGSLQVLAEVAEGAALRALISYDGAAWMELGSLTGKKQMHKLPLIPGRCDFWRLRLEGRGDWKVYAIAREYYSGSDMN